MEKDHILHGIHIGEHGFDADTVIDEIRERCVEPGFNHVCIRPRGPVFDQSYFIQWAKYLTENKIWFSFLYLTQQAPAGLDSRMTPETVAQIKEIAGDYFLGETIGEPGSAYAGKLPGYYLNPEDPTYYGAAKSVGNRTGNYRLKTYEDMEQAHKDYVKLVKEFMDQNKEMGMPNVLCVDATAFAKYNVEAGANIPILEFPVTCPDVMFANVRGTARAFDLPKWGSYAAHEWYGGIRHEDPLKAKRLELAYKYAYLSGSQILVLESGDELVTAYSQRYEKDSAVCARYREVLSMMNEYIQQDARPKGGPKVKVAFVSGLHDGWSGKWGRACLWNQFYREEWGYNDAEHSWKMLEELRNKRAWDDLANYGEHDLSGAPGWGVYDIVPIEADVEKLCQYDWLIFLGWNTMTEENMDKLTEFVRRGGHLVMSAAHLNTQTKRDGAYKMVSPEKVEELFGCCFMGEIRRSIGGAKFKYESLDERVLYPVVGCAGSDPMYIAGYADYAHFATTDGRTIAYASQGFREAHSDLPMVIENKLGKGVATLVTHTCYPGNQAVYPLYYTILREMITASARNCPVQVVGSERIRWSYYEGGKLYLLNTDYDMPITVKVIADGKEQTVTLESLELKALQL